MTAAARANGTGGARGAFDRRPRRFVPVTGPDAAVIRSDASPPSAGRSRVDPLVAAAAPVLILICESGPAGEGETIAHAFDAALRRFVDRAVASGCPVSAIQTARGALAALIEDLWGVSVGVPGESSAIRFRERLDESLRDPESHRAEIEIFHACLALGFEGGARNGDDDRDPGRLRASLYRVLRRSRGEVETRLSPSCPACPKGRAPGARLPFWIWLPLAPVILAAVWWSALIDLRSGAAEATARIEATLPAPARVVHLGPPADTAGPAMIARVSEALSIEIQTKALTVLAGADGALVIRVAGTGMFTIDGDTVSARHRAILDHVALVLAGEAGRVVVAAHLDDLFTPTDRRPSPEALTKARADAVKRLLDPRLGADRVTAVGRGMTEPVALNADAAGRAANRRVDIRLYPF